MTTTDKTDPNTLQNWEVTEKAGNFVAGTRSPGTGKTIKLTARQAETPKRNGEIIAATSKVSKKTEPSSKAS